MKESTHTLAHLGINLDSFKVVENTYGKGTYGEVKLVERDGERFAMKSLIKEDIIKVNNTTIHFRQVFTRLTFRLENLTMCSVSKKY